MYDSVCPSSESVWPQLGDSDLCQALGSGSGLTHALTPHVLIILGICMGVAIFPPLSVLLYFILL